MAISIKAGNFLYRNLYFLYRPLYAVFKKRQDRFEISLLKKLVKPGMQVIDIGANIGFYARILSQLAGESGIVHCFEPDAVNFGHLSAGTRDLKNIKLNQKAVGPSSGTIKIYTSPNLNVDHRTYEPEQYESVSEVQAAALDDYLKDQNFRADFIKMDIQGFEMQALQGMSNVLRENPNLAMISEFWPYGLRKAGSSALDYFEALRNSGFSVSLLRSDSLEALSRETVMQMQELGEDSYFNILAQR